MSEWINVKDCLPEEDTEVIIVNDGIIDCIDRAYIHNGKWKVCDDEYRFTPTHWIPFPAFPEE